MQCPDHVAVIGGGRWARVLIDVLAGVVPPDVRISIHSPGNADGMTEWCAGIDAARRIAVSPEWPRFAESGSHAAVVVNASRQHEEAAKWVLRARVPVLVEKPMATSAAAVQDLIDTARRAGALLAPAHVFLFARYLQNFAAAVQRAGEVRSIRVTWTDPAVEQRYGEAKRYDAGVPVFADCIPHALSALSGIVPALPTAASSVRLRRGGARVEVDTVAGGVACELQFERNSDRRRRIVEAVTAAGVVRLDSSTEPGTIEEGTAVAGADEQWETGMRPAATMLTAFLTAAAGGAVDPRFDHALPLAAARLTDDVAVKYRALRAPWLASALADPVADADAVRYALAELKARAEAG